MRLGTLRRSAFRPMMQPGQLGGGDPRFKGPPIPFPDPRFRGPPAPVGDDPRFRGPPSPVEGGPDPRFRGPPTPLPEPGGNLEQMPEIQPGGVGGAVGALRAMMQRRNMMGAGREMLGEHMAPGATWNGQRFTDPVDLYRSTVAHGNKKSFLEFYNAHPGLQQKFDMSVAGVGPDHPQRAAMMRSAVAQIRGRQAPQPMGALRQALGRHMLRGMRG